MLFRQIMRFTAAIGIACALRAEAIDEYHVKAAFLYNFAKFVDWPAEAFRRPGEPFSICVLGEDPFGRVLDDIVAGKEIEGRRLTVRRVPDARHTDECHILFVGASVDKRAGAIPVAPRQPGVLTVGEAGNPNSAGVIISFIPENGKVRFAINLVAAEEGKLHFSSRLLSLATLVRK